MGWEVVIFALALAGVAVGCLAPAGWLPVFKHDKLLHFLAFAMLTVLATLAVRDWAHWPWSLLALLLAGWLIEVLQKLVPGRNFCWRDMAANAGGIASAATIVMLIRAF
jgi:VanZ family protein